MSNQVKRLLQTCAALLALPFASQANPIITNVAEIGGDNEATDTVPAKWTGVTFSNGIAGEFQNPFTVPVFDEDVPAMTDRIHQYNGATAELGLPPYLVGGEYIMIGNDNRDNANFRLDITVSEEVIVYLLIDNRLRDLGGGDPPEGGLPFEEWTTMTWIATNNFEPVLTGHNRNADPTVPDELGVDEGADGVGPGAGINQYSSVYSTRRPAGTFSLYQPDNPGRNMYGVVIARPPGSVTAPPVITVNSPADRTLFYDPAGGINFTVTTVSPNTLAPENITLSLNGQQVTGLNVTGTAANRTVTYSGLTAGQSYNAQIIATDQEGRSSTNDFNFDTFVANAVIMIEAEDYNYNTGQTVAAPIAANGFVSQTGVLGADYWEQSHALSQNYRPTDFVSIVNANDSARAYFTDAGATDFAVSGIDAGEWLNYTRTVPNGTYEIFLRTGGVQAQRWQLDKVAGATTTSQTLTPVGVFNVAGGGNGYTQLTDAGGHPVRVSLNGETTLRLTSQMLAFASSINYLMLVPATGSASAAYVAANRPVGVNVEGDDVISVAVVNGTTTATAATLIVDDIEIAGASTTITPTPYGFTGSYDPPGTLAPGSAHTVRLILTDSAGTKTTNDWSFTVSTPVDLPTNIATAPGTGNGSGFTVKIHKIVNGAPGVANNLARAQGQIDGTLIEAATGLPYDNEAAGPNGDGLSTNLVLNFQQEALPSGYIGADEPYPHLGPGAHDLIGLQATAYLELPVGVTRLGIRSDDGFRVTAGPTFENSPLVVSVLDAGRGDGLPGGTTEFDVNVTQAGLYPIKLLYYEGTGGAALEFYTVDPVTKLRTLVNGTDSPIKAFYDRTTEIIVPTIAITAPTQGQDIAQPGDVEIKVDAAVQGATISKVEFFRHERLGDTKLGESTAAPFTFTWANAPRGRHHISAKVTDSRGLTATTTQRMFTIGSPISVNFQLATALPVPEGYLMDGGDIFGDRGNGKNYGWDDDNTQHSRDRNSANSFDQRYDTFNHMQKTTPLPVGTLWEIEVPNGRYLVVGASGDATATDSVFDVQAEGVQMITGTPTTGNWFFDGSATVEVTDGRLTISNGPLAANNKINFVDIFALPANVEIRLVIQKVGDSLSITWNGNGMLQSKADLNSPDWTDIGNSGTYSEAIPSTAGAKFFRVKQ